MKKLTCQHLVEDVIVPLIRCVRHDPGFLQKILRHLGTRDDATIEHDFKVLAEPGRVVVAEGLGIAEALQERGRLQDLFRNLLDKNYNKN
jgi:hypothetical protein